MNASAGVSAFPSGDSLFEWTGTLTGVAGTVYEGLTYKCVAARRKWGVLRRRRVLPRASPPRSRRLAIAIPADYPFTAPAITFVTPCWHPNVDAHGAICVDFLKERWSAAYSVSSLLLSLQSLLADPNTASPLNTAAAALWGNDVEYRRTLLAKYKEATGGGPAA